VESGDANATMLESIGAYQDVGWLQKCHLFPGATGPETRADHVNTTGRGGGGPSLGTLDDGQSRQQAWSLHCYPSGEVPNDGSVFAIVSDAAMMNDNVIPIDLLV
jgi:hypothetical protein